MMAPIFGIFRRARYTMQREISMEIGLNSCDVCCLIELAENICENAAHPYVAMVSNGFQRVTYTSVLFYPADFAAYIA